MYETDNVILHLNWSPAKMGELAGIPWTGIYAMLMKKVCSMQR